MDQHRALSFAVACLLIAAGVLCYLEWWRAGELELLHGRVGKVEDELAQARAKRARRPTTAKAEGE